MPTIINPLKEKDRELMKTLGIKTRKQLKKWRKKQTKIRMEDKKK